MAIFNSFLMLFVCLPEGNLYQWMIHGAFWLSCHHLPSQGPKDSWLDLQSRHGCCEGLLIRQHMRHTWRVPARPAVPKWRALFLRGSILGDSEPELFKKALFIVFFSFLISRHTTTKKKQNIHYDPLKGRF